VRPIIGARSTELFIWTHRLNDVEPIEPIVPTVPAVPLIRPLRGLLPAPQYAGQVAAPPYDVLSSAEARALATGNPLSFLHVSKAEIDLAEDTDPHDPAVYAKARGNLDALIGREILHRDSAPALYIYRMTHGEHRQTGLVATASIAAYESQRIRRHELTRPDKEDDRVHHMDALNAQTGPVLMAYPTDSEVDAALRHASTAMPLLDVRAATGVRHEIWAMRDPAWHGRMANLFERLPNLYIADGHHRSAAAARVARARRGRPGSDSHKYFLVVAFPQQQLRILDYNRVVADLNGLTPSQFLQRLQDRFQVTRCAEPVGPRLPGEFGVYLREGWFLLRVDPRHVPADPVGALDVSVLSSLVLAPILGITDVRRDPRIDFIGGIRGLSSLQERVDSGSAAAAFSLCPTRMADLMAVADAGEIMPPKSTWFEPKLADGLVSHVLD